MTDFTYPFDYGLYTTEEITTLIELVNQFDILQHKIQENASIILKNYEMYRHILSNQAEEKRCDHIFKERLGFSIYEMVKSAKKTI